MSDAVRFVLTSAWLAWTGLARHPLRAVLTSLGILIGVAAVTIVVALGEGASRAVASSIDSLGENALIVVPRERATSGARTDEDLSPLTQSDARAIAREVPSVAHAAPLVVSGSQVVWRDNNLNARIEGTTNDYLEIRAWEIAHGEPWSASAQKTGAKECVVGTTIRDELFLGEDPVGHVIRIGRHPYRIVGMLEPKGQSPFGSDQDSVILVPIATMLSRVVKHPPDHTDRIVLSTRTAGASERAEREIEALLRQRHGLTEGVENDFRIRSQEQFRETQDQILGALRLLLLAIAAVSLVVGGVGVMNIMLVSVAERTREIGIRMAIGARERDIMAQFLLEAVLLAVVGGAAGAAVAFVATRAIGDALGWTMSVSLEALAVALVTSATVGVLFGFVPARRAARLDPIEALGRH